MEARALIAIPFLSGAERAEVIRGLGYDVGVELEDYSCRWAYLNIRAARCE